MASRRWLPSLPVENSKAFRAWTLVVVTIGVLAVLREEEWPGFGWAVVALTVLGYGLSYLRRGRPNWLLKVVISGVMLWAFADFWNNLAGSANDPRIPLANLLLWLQTMHAFDLPHRQNLNVSFFVGLVLMSVAAVISTTGGFAYFLVAFIVACMVMLQYSYISWHSEMLARRDERMDASQIPQPVPIEAPVPVLRQIVRGTVAGLLFATVAAYTAIPHFQGMHIRTLPLSLAHQMAQQSHGSVVNPAFPQGIDANTRHTGGKVSDPDGYYGFNRYMDLNTRGTLSDEVVMRVRTSRWTYYRGLAFDKYDGQGWSLSDETLDPHTSAEPPIRIKPRYSWDEENIQIFYIEKDMPSVMFGTFQVSQVFYNGSVAYTDKCGGVRADFPLEAGTTYSIISSTQRVRPARLRRFNPHKKLPPSAEQPEPYLVLPATLPPRVRDLALKITANAASNFEKASAITNYLQQNYTYVLDGPPFPEGTDAVDQFLFVSRRGACEEFASAFAVLCRAAGVPARVVVGYLPGTFNPFAGVYEVHARDAHAWGEVLIPYIGWISFDAVPGAEAIPNLDGSPKNEWVLESVGGWLYDKLHLQRVKDWLQPRLSRIGGWMDDVATRAGTLMRSGMAGTLLVVCAGIGVLAGIGLLVWALIVRPMKRHPKLGQWIAQIEQRVPHPRFAPRAPLTDRDRMHEQYRHMLASLSKGGLRKKASQTPSEFAETAPYDEVRTVTRVFEGSRYGDMPVSAEDVRQVQQTVTALQEKLRPPR